MKLLVREPMSLMEALLTYRLQNQKQRLKHRLEKDVSVEGVPVHKLTCSSRLGKRLPKVVENL